jgi:hypothetical protein
MLASYSVSGPDDSLLPGWLAMTMTQGSSSCCRRTTVQVAQMTAYYLDGLAMTVTQDSSSCCRPTVSVAQMTAYYLWLVIMMAHSSSSCCRPILLVSQMTAYYWLV